MSNRWKGLILGVALVATPVAVNAQTAPQETASKEVTKDVRADVQTLLGGLENDPTPEAWKALGDEAAPILIAIATNNGAPVIKRGRAVVALVHFNNAESGPALRGILSGSVTPKILQRKIIWALARIEGEQAIEVVTPYLASKNLGVRESAVEALQTIGSARAHDALRARISDERSTYIKNKIETALKTPATGSTQ